MQCPHGCDCSHDASWSQNVITCSARNHTNVPLLIPMDATHVHLDGNNLGHVDQQNFLGRHRVRHLFLNNSNVRSLSNNTFQGLVGLKTLHLENNHLEQLKGYEFTTLIYLEELYLQNNELVYINEITFESLRSLRVLRLDANLLTTFPVWQLAADNRALTSVFLAQNMWSCECEFVTVFNDFLETNINAIVDYDNIQCVSSNDIIIDGENCAQSKSDKLNTDLPNNHNSDNGLGLATILVPAAVATLMLIFGILAVCVFRQSIKTWLYNKSSSIYDSNSCTNQTPSISSINSNNQQQKLFDVYVSYSLNDSEFVDATLAPTLEHSPGSGASSTSYRVCLQKRDFPANTPVQEAVAVAAESSSRVLMVLTRSYLQTEWPLLKLTFRTVIANSNSKLIILFLEDISESEMDPDLVHYVRTCPTVTWGSAGFLNKLRFFLPEPVFLTFQRNITLRTMRPSDLERLGCEEPRKKKMPRYGDNLAQPQVYSNPDHHDHMYQQIPDPAANHIYHSLEPAMMGGNRQKQQIMGHHFHQTSSPNASSARAVFLNRNLDLVLKVDPPSNSLSPVLPSVCHSYSQSTSSGANLLPPTQNKTMDEYIV